MWSPNLANRVYTNKIHEFWWLFICKRTYQNNIKNMLKSLHKKHNNANIHEPKGRQDHLPGKSVPIHGERKTKTKANHLQSMSNSIGPIKKPTRGHPPKLGSFEVHLGRTDPWCGCTPSGPFRAQLLRAASYRLSMVGCGGDGGKMKCTEGGLLISM